MATSPKAILKTSIKLKDESEQDPINPMVILVHVLRRYLSEIKKKPKYAVDDFFQGIRKEINQSIKQTQGEEKLATFTRFIDLLHQKHGGLLKGIASSDQMREKERLAIQKIYQSSGSDQEIQQLLKLLNAIKKDEAFRKRIDRLVNLLDMNQPVTATTPPKFGEFLRQLHAKSHDFKRLISHIFEKAATSHRMSKLMAAIFLALAEDESTSILVEMFPKLLAINGSTSAFVKVYAHMFLSTHTGESELDHVRRVSKLFRQELTSTSFIKYFNYLPSNKLKPANHPLERVLRSLIDRYPDFLHLLTQQIFIDSPGDILPRIPLDLVRRGLIVIYKYSEEQADAYLTKFMASITFYYQKYLPADKKNQSYFYLMIAALSKYTHELLEAIYERKIFRDSEIKTWMPLLDAIRCFHEVDDKEAKAREIWDILVPIRQKKEIRDQLTLMNNLTNVSSAAYFKDFIPFITRLTTDKEKFKLIFDHIFEQARLDKEQFQSTVDWHTNLLNNIIRYLSDISITSDPETLPILNKLVRGWLYVYERYLFELIGLLSENNLSTIRGLINYLFTYFPETLVKVIQSLIRMTDDDHKDEAAGIIQYIHTSLLEQAHLPGMSTADTQQEIETIGQLFDDCCKDIGDLRQHWEQFIFSEAYKMSISNLLKVEVQEEEQNFENDEKGGNLPVLILSFIQQAVKIFNIPNFANRATGNFSDMLEWAVDEMHDAHTDSGSLLENVRHLHGAFTEHYRFSPVSSSSVFHNFAYKNEFDHFSFCFLVYAVSKVLGWDELLFRNSWRDITVTVNGGSFDLELKKNMIVNSNAMINNKSRFFKDLNRLFEPLKAETAVEVFFHLKNGIALADTRRYRMAIISLEKAINLHKTNIYAHYWRALALKKAKMNLEQYENHIAVIEKYYPNSNEVENLKRTSY